MAHLRVADGGDGLQIRRVTANVLDKQLRTADKVWSSSLGVGRGARTSHRKKAACYEMLHKISELDGFLGRALVNTVMNLCVP